MAHLRADPAMAGLIDRVGPVKLWPRRLSPFQALKLPGHWEAWLTTFEAETRPDQAARTQSTLGNTPNGPKLAT